jgi:hypothetical protein
VTLDELKTLLALNGNQRIEYAESEIFADNIMCVHYLHEVTRHHIQEGPENYDIKFLILECSEYVIKGRWPETEHIIIDDAFYSSQYAFYVIRGRWPEAEAVIAADRYYAEQYNDRFGTNL